MIEDEPVIGIESGDFTFPNRAERRRRGWRFPIAERNVHPFNGIPRYVRRHFSQMKGDTRRDHKAQARMARAVNRLGWKVN